MKCWVCMFDRINNLNELEYIFGNFYMRLLDIFSKTCVKGLFKNRLNKGLNDNR